MQKLYLVGFTADLSGLVFSRQKGVRSGGFVVDLDDELRAALSDLYRRHTAGGARDDPPPVQAVQAREAVPRPEAPAEGAPDEAPPRRRPSSTLTPKEIQAELRSGKSVQEVARLAGTDPSWIERFLSPILAERKGIVDAVLTGFISRPRRGRSSCNVGQAIVANLKERKMAISPDDLLRNWGVGRSRGQWEVTFRYSLDGQDKRAEFAYDPEGGVTALNAEASAIGWWAPPSRRANDEDGGLEDAPPAAGETRAETSVGTAAAAKTKAKLKPTPRRDVAVATAALWGATKVTPPTAPARRSTFTGTGKGVRGGSSPQKEGIRGGSPEKRTDAPAGSSKPAGPSKPAARAPARPEPAAGPGRSRPVPIPPAESPKRRPAVADDQPAPGRSAPGPRPKRLITVADDEADWRTALAKTRAKRAAAAPGPQPGAAAPRPMPKPAPQTPSQPAPPRRKRLPDDWLTEE